MKVRCNWSTENSLYIDYHDNEWGVPIHDDCRLFEFLILEGAQAGLSWLTVLKKRDNYRKAFDYFDANKIALYDEFKVAGLLSNKGIIRNKLKIASAIRNAKAFLAIKKEFTTFDQYIWQFVQGKPIINSWTKVENIPAQTKESEIMSCDLKKRGFNFIGPTICYAFMQAVGMVNDHSVDCFRYTEVQTEN